LKITDVVPLQLRVKNVENIFDGTQDVLVVQVHTDEGYVGLGEVVSSSYVARAVIEAPRSGGGRHGLAEIVRGMDPADTDSVWQEMWEQSGWYGRRGVVIHAMAGIDVALWDIKAQAAGRPVHGALSDEPRRRIRPYASVLWGDTVAETERLARELSDHGFRAVKFGFGSIGTSLEQDVAMVRGARRALPDGATLMVDVGRRWTLESAIERCEALGPFGVRWVEEPLHPEDLDGYARLTRAVSVPIAAAETEETIPAFRAFLDAGVKVIQPDLGRVGLTQGMKLAALARERGAACVPHCFGTGVNTAASIHWMVASGNDLTEYPMRTNALCRRLVQGVPQLVDGWVTPLERPGLGLSLDSDVVREYRYIPVAGEGQHTPVVA
jgi:L-alanine-DL-glutamate epimerase-like enolase superfamily enzyme